MSTDNGLPRILVAESNKGWQKIFEEQLKDNAELVFAETPDQTIQLFQSEYDFNAITVSTSLAALDDGVEVVKFARKSGFKKPVIATGSKTASNQLLLDAGASDATDKLYFVKYIKTLVEAMKPRAMGLII